MKKNYHLQMTKIICTVLAVLCFSAISAQVEYKQLSGFGSAILDINDSGKGIRSGGVYDFTTNTTAPLDAEVYSLSGINNNGDLIGTMPYNTDYTQPAYKKAGVWHPMGYFPGATSDAAFSLGQISENGEYIAGQMSPDCCDYQAFLYHVSTSSIERIADPANEYGAGYAVNNSGILGGWYDPQPEGTLRVPAIMATGSVITAVPNANTEFGGQVSSVNNAKKAAGDRDGKPFIYDLESGEFTEFNVPAGYETATFTSISDNGVAVGYAQSWIGGSPVRDAIIYNPALGSQPILIAEILAAHNIDILSSDGKLGTAIAISPDGNYVGGWENGFFFFAAGWVINFDDLLLSSCYIQCPQDVTITSLTGPKAVEYALNVNCNSTPNTSIVLVSGLESGSLFPVGTTEVVHNLVDENGVVMNTCTFTVTITEDYCTPEFDTVEPITRVKVANIDNASDVNNFSAYEDFTDVVANVVLGSTYPTICEGYSGVDYVDFITAYIDWDHDGIFSETTEKYELGSISGSNGEDLIQANGSITVPANAVLGNTTMRIAKTWDVIAASACDPGSGFGQVEDYTLNVAENLGTGDFNQNAFSYYPNPVTNTLNVAGNTAIDTVLIYNTIGQEVSRTAVNATAGQINVSQLPSGAYLVKATSGKTVKTFKIIRE